MPTTRKRRSRKGMAISNTVVDAYRSCIALKKEIKQTEAKILKAFNLASSDISPLVCVYGPFIGDNSQAREQWIKAQCIRCSLDQAIGVQKSPFEGSLHEQSKWLKFAEERISPKVIGLFEAYIQAQEKLFNAEGVVRSAYPQTPWGSSSSEAIQVAEFYDRLKVLASP